MKELADHTKVFLRNIHEKGFFHLFSANILIQLFAFASQLLVASMLAPEDIGRIKIIQTYLSIFSIIGGMGFNSSTLKLCANENISSAEKKTIFLSALVFTGISGTCLYLFILIANYLHLFSTDEYIRWLIPIGLFPVISNSLFLVFVSYAQANKRIKLMSRLTISNKLISIIGIILFTFWVGIKGYYIAFNLSFILMLLACIFWGRKQLLFGNLLQLSSQSILSYFKRHWHYAKSIVSANLFSEVSAYIDILLIGFFIKDMGSIGFYGFALTLTIIFRLFPSTVQQISLPYFSSATFDKSTYLKIYKQYNKILYLAVCITLLAAYAIIPIFSHWVFNGKYDASMYYFFPLALGWSIRQLTQLQAAAIFGLGKIQYTAYNNLISIFVNLAVFGIALHFWGLQGAAYASILTNSLFVIILSQFFKRALKEF